MHTHRIFAGNEMDTFTDQALKYGQAGKEKETDKKPDGKAPRAPGPSARGAGRINLTYEKLRIMPLGRWLWAVLQRASGVVAYALLLVTTGLSQAPQIEPMLRGAAGEDALAW